MNSKGMAFARAHDYVILLCILRNADDKGLLSPTQNINYWSVTSNATSRTTTLTTLMVNIIVGHDRIAEQCATHLLQYDSGLVTQLWAEGQTIFMSDPLKYPCSLAPQQDTVGRNQSRSKCLEL